MELKIEYLPITDLKPYDKNTRKHEKLDVDNIAKSIDKYGMCDAIGIWVKDNIIVEGHGRMLACKQLGIETVPCVRLDHLTDEQRREYAIAHNATAELSFWDKDFLAEELAVLDMSDFDFDFEIDSLVEDETEIVEDEVPEVDEESEPITKLGDIWQLGRHRLMCGDSTDKATVELLMNGNKADMTFTSPPYNIGKSANLANPNKDSKYQSYDDDNDDYIGLITESTRNAIDFSKYAFINIQMIAGNKREMIEWLNVFNNNLCDVAIWYKNNPAPAIGEKVMTSAFEFVWVFSAESTSRAIGTKKFRGTVKNVYQSNIQSGNEYSDIHSATFPITFVSHFVENFSNNKDSVIDLFGGTGTTLIACEQLDRTCYMMELDPKYCDVIIKRWEILTCEKAVLING